MSVTDGVDVSLPVGGVAVVVAVLVDIVTALVEVVTVSTVSTVAVLLGVEVDATLETELLGVPPPPP
jgi:hypothetical protein